MCEVLQKQSTHSTDMEISKPKSFFQDIRSREINGFRVRKRPYVGSSDLQDLESIRAVAVEHLGEPSPSMALSFFKTSRNAHILALTDERGYVNLLHTRGKFLNLSSFYENTDKLKYGYNISGVIRFWFLMPFFLQKNPRFVNGLPMIMP